MAFLREAVEKQKMYLIQQLIAKGIVDKDDQEVYNKPISEIVHDYEKFCIEFDKQNAIKITRYTPPKEKERPNYH
ncbi:Fur-regulated basic protein FbpA [Gracilibacillus sp. S3-1-1]|uniref:Fur-regulated basic protein FbpA n=1 Tax=Gracilibacillus pellucidus TaxID=3095368 RepID=A0ACC6M2P0_9BACI|nr:Fur-regulated basic protein FbpA [Gracilibacillus sp. S3-1-1]MDX8045216.1 Fur-regulated basic protein FbpA [Gracilibacillus sp. S3-1-1]